MKELLVAEGGRPLTRPEIEKRFLQLSTERGETTGGARRLFLGSQERAAGLRVMDADGRERIRLVVGSDNAPRLEFLDDRGRAVLVLPEVK